MRILLVGDDYIGSDCMRNGFVLFQEHGYELVESNWLHGGMDKMSEMNRVVEREGPEAVSVHDEVFDLIRDAEMLVIQFLPVSGNLIDAAPELKYIGTLRTGLENIDMEYTDRQGDQGIQHAGTSVDCTIDCPKMPARAMLSEIIEGKPSGFLVGCPGSRLATSTKER